MFNKLDEADCEARDIKQPTTDDGGDRASPTHLSFLFAVVELTALLSGCQQLLQYHQTAFTSPLQQNWCDSFILNE
jgi:hypothetical protein